MTTVDRTVTNSRGKYVSNGPIDVGRAMAQTFDLYISSSSSSSSSNTTTTPVTSKRLYIYTQGA
jgi:hypothetical protein